MNRFDTHEVFNQAPPFGDVNLFRCDPHCRKPWRARVAAGLQPPSTGWVRRWERLRCSTSAGSRTSSRRAS